MDINIPTDATNNNKTFIQKIAPFIIIFLFVGFAAASGTAYYFYMQFAKLQKNPQQVVQDETNKLLAQVSKLMVLPEGEMPTIATVNDPERLKDQPFFAKAKKGDKVLIYANAKKAILYDPVENKIVEIAPINIGAPKTTTPTPIITPEQ